MFDANQDVQSHPVRGQMWYNKKICSREMRNMEQDNILRLHNKHCISDLLCIILMNMNGVGRIFCVFFYFTTGALPYQSTDKDRNRMNKIRQRQSVNFYFLDGNVWISNKISLKWAGGLINANLDLVQVVVWCQTGGQPSPEIMITSSHTYVCLNRTQWVKSNPITAVMLTSIITGCSQKSSKQHFKEILHSYVNITNWSLKKLLKFCRCHF